MEMSQLSERSVFPKVSINRTVAEYSRQMGRKLKPSMNKKVLQLFHHKYFGKHTMQKRHYTCLLDTQNCHSSGGKQELMKVYCQ